MTKLVVGLTGGIGTGKSTVAAMMADRGATVVDCDGLGRLVVEPGGSAHHQVVERFGRSIVQGDGSIDRPALAALVFNEPDALADLNTITHPAIEAEMDDRIAGAPTDTVVLDMAILVETDLGMGRYGPVVVVEAPLETRLERLWTTLSMDRSAAQARMANQADDADRRAVADHVIVNDADLATLDLRVGQVWAALGS